MSTSSPRPAAPADAGAALAEIAEAACAIILPLWRTGVTVDLKTDQSPVTEADRRAEYLILERLSHLFPDTPVVAEEQSSALGPPGTVARRFFLVDPLDGTKAFVRGDAQFTVNIALIEDRIPICAAVAAPATGEVWFTTQDGARKRQIGETGGEPIHVRRGDPDDLLALTSHALKPEQEERLRSRYGFARRHGMHSSLKLCRIAEGAADLYPRHGPTMEWDVAAGHALLVCAGGTLTTPEGEPFLYGKAEDGFLNGWFVARGGC